MKVQQFKLEHKTQDGSSKYLTAWIPVDSRLKKGVIISLSIDPDMKWIVVEKYSRVLESTDLHIDWKVGGLG